MLVLCSEGLGLGLLDPGRYRSALLFTHVEWEGFVPWELVMPCFMFMVGASLPLALAKRTALGQSFGTQTRHVAVRTLRMVLIGQMLWCYYAGRYSLDPIETLTQLALSYFCCFFILQLEQKWQVLVALSLVAVNWLVYVVFPGAEGAFSPTSNVGLRIDQMLFGITRDSEMNWNSLNFLGSTVTVLFGAWTTQLLRSNRDPNRKLMILLGTGSACLVLWQILLPFNPLIHKCWTTSFIACHTGFALLLTAAAYFLFDVRRYERLAFPLIVVGMNSIFIYLVNNSLKGGWLSKTVGIFTEDFEFLPWGIAPAVQGSTVCLIMWLICYWLYRRRIFFKI